MMEAREFQLNVHDDAAKLVVAEGGTNRRRTGKAQRIARRIMAFIAVVLMETVPAILAGASVGIWLIPAAYRERGYVAFGGEWLLILIVMLGTSHVIHTALWKRLRR